MEMDKLTYICITCRFTSKWSGSCPICTEALRGMYNFKPPRKHDDREWKKVELSFLVHNSNIQLCIWSCCVPLSRPTGKGSGRRVKELTLSQYKARIKRQRTHRQGTVPKYNDYQYKWWLREI